jgi:hypothetical protein
MKKRVPLAIAYHLGFHSGTENPLQRYTVTHLAQSETSLCFLNVTMFIFT